MLAAPALALPFLVSLSAAFGAVGLPQELGFLPGRSGEDLEHPPHPDPGPRPLPAFPSPGRP